MTSGKFYPLGATLRPHCLLAYSALYQAQGLQVGELPMVQRTPAKGEPDQALACYGAVCHLTQERWLYLAEGQPNSDRTILFLQALLTIAQQKAKRVLVVIWDQASWHKSQRVKHWVHHHNQQARQQDGVRLLTYLLPSKSPWLNPMEPIWIHTKRKVAEPDIGL